MPTKSPNQSLSLEGTPTHQTLSRQSHCISYCSCSHQFPSRLLQFCSLWRTSLCHTQTHIEVQNSLARIVLQSDSLANSEPLQRQLHWLPVYSRIRFKLATITYKVELGRCRFFQSVSVFRFFKSLFDFRFRFFKIPRYRYWFSFFYLVWCMMISVPVIWLLN